MSNESNTTPTEPAPMNRRPAVAIVGRPNVGKSTLVNRIIGRREAIVEERPGVTRDRKVVEADWIGYQFDLIDTGGWLPGGSELDKKVSRQSELAIDTADVVIFVVDAAVGVTSDDDAIARVLRKSTSPVLLVANKIDDESHHERVWDLLSLGFDEPHPISALHGRGTGDLLDAVVEHLERPEKPEVDVRSRRSRKGRRNSEREEANNADDAADASSAFETNGQDIRSLFSVSLVGRPNVGKSTLFNRLIGEDRAVTHDMPGTTRDSIDTVVETEHGPIRFVDTAGMRRKSRINEGTEYFSMVRALKSVDACDVALLVIDATEGITHQDQRLAERVDAAGCPIVVLLNKWELVNEDQRNEVTFQLNKRLHFIGGADVLRISALSGRGVQRLLPALETSIRQYHRRVPTSKVNQVLRKAQNYQPGPHGVRVMYATQGATDPPTFTLFANKEVPPSYLRYLERSLREALDMESTPIKMRVRRRDLD